MYFNYIKFLIKCETSVPEQKKSLPDKIRQAPVINQNYLLPISPFYDYFIHSPLLSFLKNPNRAERQHPGTSLQCFRKTCRRCSSFVFLMVWSLIWHDYKNTFDRYYVKNKNRLRLTERKFEKIKKPAFQSLFQKAGPGLFKIRWMSVSAIKLKKF